jgi:hypothetical protein
MPVEKAMEIDDDDVKGNYKINLAEFTVKYKESGRVINGKRQISEDQIVMALIPDDDLFESQKEIEIYAKVGFQKYTNNQWVSINSDDGKPLYEEKKETFRTGDRPKEIAPEDVKYSYPVNRQYNFYPREYGNGYILLSKNYDYLFSTDKPEGFNQVVRISDGKGNTYDTPFTYTTHAKGSDIRMEIDFPLDKISFQTNQIYKLAIVNVPQLTNVSITSNITSTTTAMEGMDGVEITQKQATGTLEELAEMEIYSLNFKSSRYNTFAEKIKTFDKRSEGWRDYMEPFIHFIKTNLREPELFDAYEIKGVNNVNPMIRFEAQVNKTDWYNQSIYKGMYQLQSYLTPPVKNVEILTEKPEKLLTEDEMNIGAASGFNTQGIFRYALPYACALDLYTAKREFAKNALKRQMTQQEVDVMNADFPPVVLKGDYPVDVSYVLPGRDIKTSTVSITMYNPVEP